MILNTQSRKLSNLLSVNDLKNSDIEAIFNIAKKENFKTNRSGFGISLFFENSTRTLLSFEIALANCGLNTIRFETFSSSLAKEETVVNTIRTINSLSPNFLIARCKQAGEPEIYSKYLDSKIHLINAGDGSGEHPTQALIDFYTILQTLNLKFKADCLKGKTIVIAGDIMHSRVARSNIFLLSRFGAKIILASPINFLPPHLQDFYKQFGCNFTQSLKDVSGDFIMMLRIQKERMEGSAKIPFPTGFGIFTEADLNGAFLMHPGPINEGVEVSEFMAYQSPKSLISKQVENGVSVRSAIIKFLSEAK